MPVLWSDEAFICLPFFLGTWKSHGICVTNLPRSGSKEDSQMRMSGAKNYEINGGLQVIAKRLLPPVCACAMLWLAAYALCLNKNAPSLASCNLNKH